MQHSVFCKNRININHFLINRKYYNSPVWWGIRERMKNFSGKQITNKDIEYIFSNDNLFIKYNEFLDKFVN